MLAVAVLVAAVLAWSAAFISCFIHRGRVVIVVRCVREISNFRLFDSLFGDLVLFIAKI